MKITFQSPPKNLDEKMISNVLRDYKILNCEALIRDDNGEFFLPHSAANSATQPKKKKKKKYIDKIHSNNRRLHRRNHERPPQIHPLSVCIQQDRRSQSGLPERARPRTVHGRDELRARSRCARCRGADLEGVEANPAVYEAVRFALPFPFSFPFLFPLRPVVWMNYRR